MAKAYKGDRTIDGVLITVDGVALDPRLDVHTFTDWGLDWSYEGDGPRQLALALLVDHLGDPEEAKRLTEDFMARVVANFGNEWEMKSSDIDQALANISADA